MDPTMDEPESDWVHAVFGVFREEVISLASDFGTRVKREIDSVAATHDVRPPSATALLTAVAVESGNIATSLLRREPGEPADEDPDASPDESPDQEKDDV